MTFDPLADIIDLRDVLEDANDPDAPNEDAQEFLCSMLRDLGYSTDDWASEVDQIVDNDSTVIARRYFVEYAQELASETWSEPGTPPWEDNVWPLYCIDWEYAARELKYDYSSFTYDGRDYLIRSI